MNILVIGNGFDLAHELPTKYTDFLEFIKVIKQVVLSSSSNQTEIDWENIHPKVCEQIKMNMGNVRNNLYSQKSLWSDLLSDNVWIGYFLQCNIFLKENWIDFESEIGRIIKSIDKDMNRSGGATSIVRHISDIYFNNFFLDNLDERIKLRDEEARLKCFGLLLGEQSKYIENYRQENQVIPLKSEIRYKDLIVRLEKDLNKLIRALEIYLTEYVEKIDIKDISPDVQDIAVQINPDTHTALPVKVISFNYTNTFEKLYGVSQGIEYDYIHGKADIKNTIDSNNMVLGIDEYLGKKRRNKDIEFIAFKKYYQRIHKQTGCKYKEWVDKIRQDCINYLQKLENAEYMEQRYIPGDMQRMTNRLAISAIKGEKCPIHNLYIFGHSLDITDKDILRDLILNDNVHTTIFYHNKDAMGQQIANLVKVIGQKELIRRTGGKDKLIEFKLQQPMKKRVEK